MTKSYPGKKAATRGAKKHGYVHTTSVQGISSIQPQIMAASEEAAKTTEKKLF